MAATDRLILTQLGIEIIHLPATEGFTMGSTKYSDEQPVRSVALSAVGLSRV